MSVADLSLRELRANLAPYRGQTLRAALVRIGVAAALYGLAVRAAISGVVLPFRLLAAVLAGLFSGTLFMIGHDACHGSFTGRKRWDRVLGRLAFLPTYHPYSTWAYSHNRVHHVYTNLKGKDFVWRPLSKPEFDALRPWRRLLYRLYRTPVGLALYYPLELWRERLVFPARAHLDRPRRIYTADRLLVLAFLVVQLAVVVARRSASVSGPSAAALGVGVPVLTFSWLVGFVVYFNHTHPRVTWYDTPEDWSFANATLRGTVHLRFPTWTRCFASNIMAHVAHHADPRIPLGHLLAAEERLEALVPGVIVQSWDVKELLRILRVCRLYDYEARHWIDYDGRPAAPPEPVGGIRS